MHVTIKQGIRIVKTRLTGHGIHIIHVRQAKTPNRSERILEIQTRIRKSHRVLHLRIKVTIEVVEAHMRRQRPMRKLTRSILILLHFIRVGTLNLLLLRH